MGLELRRGPARRAARDAVRLGGSRGRRSLRRAQREGGVPTSGRSCMMTTRWSSIGSATCATVHVSPSRTSVSPTWGTRSVTAYSHAPVGKRMVIVSEATGLPSPLDLARCQVGTARGRAAGGEFRLADFVPFETLWARLPQHPGSLGDAFGASRQVASAGTSSTTGRA